MRGTFFKERKGQVKERAMKRKVKRILDSCEVKIMVISKGNMKRNTENESEYKKKL